ncbi:alpha/beta fold hydrolase [Pedobacter hartonius]|nr:alpha/beta hydrolase [Pedobacter hartonius]
MKMFIRKQITKPLFHMVIMAMASLLTFSSCSKDDNNNGHSAKTFVLVHGSFQAPYAWQFVKARLEALGQKVVVVELPGHGQDQTDPKTISIKTYRDKVVQAITAINGPVVLVGHSLGGAVITAVTDTIPERVEKLVYLAGFVPANNQSILDLTMMDPNSLFGPALTFSAAGATASIANDKIVSVFAQDGNDQVKKLLMDNNRPEPIAAQADKLILKNPSFAAVPKYYIQTTQDHAVTIDLQKKMISAAGIMNVYSVDSGHCPMLTQPDKVSDLLLQISR